MRIVPACSTTKRRVSPGAEVAKTGELKPEATLTSRKDAAAPLLPPVCDHAICAPAAKESKAASATRIRVLILRNLHAIREGNV